MTQTLISQLAPILPILLMLPRYFSGAMTMGDVMQGRNAFNQMSSSLSWFMQSYGTIATQIAIVNRLRAFDLALEQAPVETFAIGEMAAPALFVENLEVALPSGVPLVSVPRWEIATGERWVLRGASGAGKSTLLRAIAGLWPEAKGIVRHLPPAQVMFLPQRGYLPIGSLRAALSFPAQEGTFSDGLVCATLQRFQLMHLAARLDEIAPWTEVLSPGEQQRLGFVRVLLHRPALLVMDEATSALDHENATLAYETVLAEMPAISIISVVHDDALEAYHDHLLRIRDGTATVHSLPL